MLTLGYGWTTGVRFPAGAVMGFFSLPPRQDRLWGPPSLPFNGYRGFLPRPERGAILTLPNTS